MMIVWSFLFEMARKRKSLNMENKQMNHNPDGGYED